MSLRQTPLHAALSACLLLGCGVEPPLILECNARHGIEEEAHEVSRSLYVQFSRPAGFYTSDFELSLEATPRAARIYYTVDGARPRPEAVDCVECDEREFQTSLLTAKTHLYEGPIDLAAMIARPNQLSRVPTSLPSQLPRWREPDAAVQKAVVIRAQAVLGQLVSPVTTQTYFIDPSGSERYGLPVVSLSTESANLFDESCGMYVVGADPEHPNYDQRGEAWESPAHLELFDESGERSVSQQLGFRIHGGYSRRFPQKSLRLYARREYGPSHLHHRIFDTKDQPDFKRLLLHNGGNDWGGTLFRDATLQGLVRHLSFETQHAKPNVVFINGEYWGIHAFRDRLDHRHLDAHHGLPSDEITILDHHFSTKEGREEDREAFRQFLDDLAAKKLATVESIDRHVSLPELLDYTATQCYAGNTDWPQNNLSIWRYFGPEPSVERGPRDGRWRPLLFDVDRTLGRNPGTEFDMISYLFGARKEHPSRQLFRGLVRQDEIRHEFLQRLAMHLATTFEPGRVGAAIAQAVRTNEAEMPEHIERWGSPQSMDQFYSHVDACFEFARQRPDRVRRHVVDYFDEVRGTAHLHLENLPTTHPLSLHGVILSADTPGVTIREGAWDGIVFAGVPLELKAQELDFGSAIWDREPLDLELESDRMRFVLEPDTELRLDLRGVSTAEVQPPLEFVWANSHGQRPDSR